MTRLGGSAPEKERRPPSAGRPGACQEPAGRGGMFSEVVTARLPSRRRGELDIAQEIAGVPEDGPAFRPVAEEGEAGGVVPRARWNRFPTGDEAHLLVLLGGAEVAAPRSARMNALRSAGVETIPRDAQAPLGLTTGETSSGFFPGATR